MILSMKKNLLLLILFVVLFFSCTHPSNKHEDKTVFRYNEASGVSSLDPAFAKGQADIWTCNQLYNGLTQMDDDLNVIPCIAYKWENSGDGKKYTFHLRNDAFFHDHELFRGGKGRKVVAADFIYSYERILSPKIASPGSWVFNSVKPAEPFEATDDSTFIIYLKEPFPPFLGLLTSQYCSVVPHEIVEHYGKDFRTHPVGTGAFKFKEWVERTNLIYLKNENYFEFENGKRLPFIDAISISFINDRQSAFLEFIKGNLDFISGIDGSYKDDLLTRTGNLKSKYHGKFQMETCPYLNTEYLGILMDENIPIVKSSPLKNKKIRQAINYGFDKRKMITYLRNGIGTAGTSGIVPVGLPSFDSAKVKGYDYHPEKAKQLLADAGYPGGNGLPVITLSTTHEYLDLCEYIQGQLSEIGIRIKLEVNQGAQHREMVAKQQLNFFRASWIADYADAENYLSLFYSENFAPDGPNYTHFKNDEFDKLYEKASSEVNDSLRYIYYQQMDSIIISEAPVVVLYYDKVVRLYGNNISGLGKNGMNLLSIKKVKKEN